MTQCKTLKVAKTCFDIFVPQIPEKQVVGWPVCCFVLVIRRVIFCCSRLQMHQTRRERERERRQRNIGGRRRR